MCVCVIYIYIHYIYKLVICPQIISWNISSTVPAWLWPWYWGPKVKSFFMAQRRAETGPTDLETTPESWDSWNPRRTQVTQGRGAGDQCHGISSVDIPVYHTCVYTYIYVAIYIYILNMYMYVYIYISVCVYFIPWYSHGFCCLRLLKLDQPCLCLELEIP